MSVQPLEPTEQRRMTHAEAVMLCRYAKAACPQQQFDEYTPDAWSDLLADLRFDDCKAALKIIVQRQPFVAPAEIREEVARVRNKRIGEYGPIPEPMHLDRDAESFNLDYQVYMRDTMRAIADGVLLPGQLPPGVQAIQHPISHDVISELGQLGHPHPTEPPTPAATTKETSA